MRLGFITLILLIPLLPPSAAAQDYGSSGTYSIVRWDEDYSYLSDPAKRTDFFDPVKYIPIGSSPDAYISFGGQVRDRFDYFNNNEFGGGPRDTGFNLIRLLAHADVHINSHIRAFLQLNTSLEDGRAGGPRTGDAEDFDIAQAFVDLSFPFGDSSGSGGGYDYGSSIVLRVGRQELIYGAQRLVSPNDWRNVRQSFDGVKASVYLPNDTLDVFLTRPVLINKTHLNSDDDKTYFGGIYNVTELPRVLPDAHSKLDLYLLSLNKTKSSTSAVDANTYTVGARFHTTPMPWDFDFEPDWQFGTNAGDQIAAWAVAAEAGYTFQNVPLNPRLALGGDVASGSSNPTRRFNQLFPPLYMYLGHLYIFGRQNIIDVHPELTLDLTPSVSVNAAQHFFWRQNVNDAVYNLTGGVVRATGASRAAYIGSEFDISLNWQIQRHLNAYFGYAHFFTGPFIQQTGPHEDEDFAYAMGTFTF
jgi:hypothetical protein